MTQKVIMLDSSSTLLHPIVSVPKTQGNIGNLLHRDPDEEFEGIPVPFLHQPHLN